MRAILMTAALVLSCPPTLAEEPVQRPAEAALLRVLQSEGLPGTEPVLAETAAGDSTAPYQAALVEQAASVVRLVLVRRARPGQFEVMARSAPIGGLRGANFGFGIESFRFTKPDRLELALSARASCARALYTHRFALRRDEWLVTGLDIEMPRCIDAGAQRPFPMAQFPPPGPEAAYAEMQP